MKNEFRTIEFKDDHLILIDQTKLPLVEEYIRTDDYERIAVSIERLEVRGAPAIGVAAAYGLALAMKNVSVSDYKKTFEKAHKRLFSTRPTAVNLFYALDNLTSLFKKNKTSPELYDILLERAKQIHQEDVEMCDAIGKNGLEIFKKKSVALTHCNAGALATSGSGTALAVIKTAFDAGLVSFAYADETRPLLQGSRLTAFEFEKAGIPFAINTDSSAAALMEQGKIDLVVTGADRIASNGDAANKIGTYSLAVLCKHHNIPFYIAAPSTTIDTNCWSGKEIKIEFRDGSEISQIKGVQITKPEYSVFAPAFDVTPHELIAGIITEKKLFTRPYNFE